MVRMNDIRSLTDFQRNTKEHLKRLRKTGQPEVLTVNGQAEIVVQSADSYQRLLDAANLTDSVEVLGKRLASMDAGVPGIPIREFDASMRRRHRIGRKA